jgi:U3 small nucleolar RNA-associated protein 4
MVIISSRHFSCARPLSPHARLGSTRALRKKFKSQPALSCLARRAVNAVFHSDSLYTNCTYRQWRLVDLYQSSLHSPHTMDVHRSRFVPYPTSPISAVAFSRNSDSGYSGVVPALKLAIGRENGSIEIWDPQKGLWNQEVVFAGENQSVDALVWTQDPDEKDAEGNVVVGQQRLFSIASSPAVTEWDLATGQPKRKSTGNFSEVWCIAAQPKPKPGKSSEEEQKAQDIVGGCGDGALVLLSTQNDDLEFKRFLARVSGKRARCMSVAYKDQDIVVAGFADSMIRIFDTRNGSLLRNMSLGVGIPGAPKTAMIWQVKCLPNGDIVSGDSNGEVRFWDGKSYSLSQRLTGHDADCLDLIVSNDGRSVFSGGLDGRIAVYRQSIQQNGRKTWAKGSHRRVHHGEVKAMASFDSKHLSVVVSGGNDITPMVTPLREYGKENVRGLPSLPSQSPVTSAPKARLLVSWWDQEIHIWRIARQYTLEALPEQQRPRKLVAKITLDSRDPLTSVSISPDGKLLAASTNSEVKAFQLRKRVDSDGLAVRRLDVPEDLADSGARLVTFSQDGKWLAAASPESEVQIVRFTADVEKPKLFKIIDRVVDLDRPRRKTQRVSGYNKYDHAITRMAFNDEGSVLVTGDITGYLDSWVLEGHEDITAPELDLAKNDSDKGSDDGASDSSSDSDDDDDAVAVFYGQHWSDNPNGHLLPKLDSTPLVLTFRPQAKAAADDQVNGNPGVHSTRSNPHAHSHALPQGPHRLFVVTARHQMYELDILAGKLSEWSRRNPTAVLPDDFTKIRDRVVGAVWDTSAQRERIWLYGSTWVFMLNVGQNLDDGLILPNKRRRPSEYEQDAFGAMKRIKGASSGAGSRMPVAHRAPGQSGSVKVTSQNGDALAIRSDNDDDGDIAMEDDDEDAEGLQLTRLRSDDANNLAASGEYERKFWGTFKYRPILGMVPLEDDSGKGEDVLEVVVVERPAEESRGRGGQRRA